VSGLFQRFASGNTKITDASYARRRQDYLFGTVKQLARDVKDQTSRVKDLEERLAQRPRDPEFQGVQDNFCLEATREAIDERRRMLCHAK
jgi:hypothetical protein